MNKSYIIVFFGILAIGMGIGNNESEFIPSKFKLIVGSLAIVYGIYLIYKTKKNAQKSSEKTSKKIPSKKYNKSYLYLSVGVFCLILTKYLIRVNEYKFSIWTIFTGVIGFLITIYGAILFFKEKRKNKNI